MSTNDERTPPVELMRHLLRRHQKPVAWINQQLDDLRSAHRHEHESGRADHWLSDDVEGADED